MIWRRFLMANLTMIDSSCWIKFFRNSDKDIADKVQLLIENDSACICGIIELEILQGIKSAKQRSQVEESFYYIKYFDFQRRDFINAGNRIRNLRKDGITIAPSDVLIAEICIRNSFNLFTLDNDFQYTVELKKYV
jgi:predicted nucleic acid-binding protein